MNRNKDGIRCTVLMILMLSLILLWKDDDASPAEIAGRVEETGGRNRMNRRKDKGRYTNGWVMSL